MKIIFDSKGEFTDFIRRLCPADVTGCLTDDECYVDNLYDYDEKRCKECWRKSPVTVEVKNENNI